MNKQFLIVIFFLLDVMIMNAQDTTERCAFGKMRAINEFTQSQTLYKTEAEDDNRIFTIPVVVHIIHNGGPENIPDKNVRDQIDVLNEDFGKYGGGLNNFGFSSDTRIRFCLASIDPQGHPSTGIIRVKSSFSNLKSDNEEATKDLSRWDTKRYLNIWIVRSIDGSDQTSGYAYLAEDMNASSKAPRIDGVVINYHFFGRKEFVNYSNSNLGHTTTHEIGHYFNLLHVWGQDGPHQGDCFDDDEVDDTPLCDGKFFSKYLLQYDSCQDPIQCGRLRLVADYMDYSEDHCLNTFTNGQKYRMRQAILKYRTGLVSYGNQYGTGCEQDYHFYNPADDKIIVSPTLAGHSLNLYPNLSKPVDATVRIYDAAGRKVYETIVSGLQREEVVLSGFGFRNGIYIVLIITPERSYSQKVMFK
jgi:hypothetical protein